MCLILDVNMAGLVDAPQFAPIVQALATGKARAVYGGTKLGQEYVRAGERFRGLIRELDGKGHARQLPRALIDAEEQRLAVSGLCRSNDHHILAVARIGRVRLLCTHQDHALIADFKANPLLDQPRGQVYRSPRNARLIPRHCAKK